MPRNVFRSPHLMRSLGIGEPRLKRLAGRVRVGDLPPGPLVRRLGLGEANLERLCGRARLGRLAAAERTGHAFPAFIPIGGTRAAKMEQPGATNQSKKAPS